MCGRTACTLAPGDLVTSCTYINKKGAEEKPTWIEAPNGRSYYPSYNVCPGAMTPILLSSKHLESPDDQEHPETEWTLMPMQWGLVPSWHTGDARSATYKMTNARSDGILSKRSFKAPLEKGRRCVVIVDGYYEWNTGKDGSKQPYFIYYTTDDVISNDITKQEGADESSPICDAAVTHGRRLLMMAGLFDVWKSETGSLLFSYSIITVDAHSHVSWIHHRMPAILNGEAEVAAWLNFDDVTLTSAVTSLIRPRDCLRQYAVARSVVGNVHNKSEECVMPLDLQKENQKKKASNSLMQSWLKKSKSPPSKTSQTKHENESETKCDTKRIKSELYESDTRRNSPTHNLKIKDENIKEEPKT